MTEVRTTAGSAAGNAALFAFLQGTCDRGSPLYRLGGQRDVLREIWCLACEEWWDLHIDRYPRDIPELIDHPYWPERGYYPEERKECGGCPAAVIARGVAFPPPAVVPLGTFENQESEHLFVNMMPFVLTDLETLPPHCRQYRGIIEKCLNLNRHPGAPEDNIAYLTIDERPVLRGAPQRRGGLHVESPGFLPVLSGGDEREARFIPGAEHHWGRGMMMRHQHISGGIFMASNVSDTCAIWNSKIIDADGSVIGPHGSIERMRGLLGEPEMTLQAGDLVWITDKTPHESLPVQQDVVRQFIRVVTGDISAWFADHSTPNPLGVVPPARVRIVHGSKFELYRGVGAPWKSGSTAENRRVEAEMELRNLLYYNNLGHIANGLVRGGIGSVEQLVKVCGSEEVSWRGDSAWYSHIKNLFDDGKEGYHGEFYFEIPLLRELVAGYAKCLQRPSS